MSDLSLKTKDFLILAENYKLDENLVKDIKLETEMIGFVFYASGDMAINVSINKKENQFIKKAGVASSFYYSPEDTKIQHEIDSKKPLNKISLFIPPEKLRLILGDDKSLEGLLKPNAPFVQGETSFLNNQMYSAINKIVNNDFSGPSKNLMIESQAIELLSHYLDNISEGKIKKHKIIAVDIDRLHYAKDIILNKLQAPPSLNELSKQIGLNTFKLKNGFKELFGLPVHQYIKNEKLNLAFKSIQEYGNSVQEAAWDSGYDSLGSFSNAFFKKFGIRPSDLKK